MRVGIIITLIAVGFILLMVWAYAPVERPFNYPAGQPGATPIAYILTPTPIGFRALGVHTPTPAPRDCGHQLEPASLRCLRMGAVRPSDTWYSYAPTGGQGR